MDQHRQLAVAETERVGCPAVEDAVDALELDEVVARAGRAQLTSAALMRALGDRLGLGAGQAAARLGPLEVVRAGEAATDERTRAGTQHVIQLLRGEQDRAMPARAGRNRARELVHERLSTRTELLGRQRQREQPHAAVDVVADAARRDDPVRQSGRRDTTDRKTVALVDIGHRQRRLDDARKRGDVLQLLERAVGHDRLEQHAVDEDARGHAHVGTRGGRNLPKRLVQLDELKRRRRRERASHPLPARRRARSRRRPSRAGAAHRGSRRPSRGDARLRARARRRSSDELLDLPEEEQLIQPVDKQQAAVTARELDPPVARRSGSVRNDELGERVQCRREDPRLARRPELDLHLAAMLDEAMRRLRDVARSRHVSAPPRVHFGRIWHTSMRGEEAATAASSNCFTPS
jgi:hypothetical protein